LELCPGTDTFIPESTVDTQHCQLLGLLVLDSQAVTDHTPLPTKLSEQGL